MPRKTGRKVGDQSEKMERCAVTIGDSTRRLLMVLGQGNMSEGIRRAARVAYDRYQREDWVDPAEKDGPVSESAMKKAP